MSGAAVAEPALAFDDEELALIGMLADGLVLDVVARRMALSPRTVRRRIRSLCERLGVDSPVQVIVIAVRAGVL